ncbi:hypothetical protein [Borrelia sp. RT5S]|uniref:hypothetical protein n=1 Tax=Borrelia sp. RT5S TaxID=2898581 RepID=UPI001E3F193F|nr:hypothetical protein [Borrelia sp. RT5S]UGQ16641.1 hypothetical protein LSO06_04820 [Borrelia sp. RT5S]
MALMALLAGLAGSVSKILTQDLGKAFAQNTARGADAFIASTVQDSKDIVSNLGVWGQLAVAIFDFTVGIFKGIEAKAIAEIEKRRDEELDRLAKQSEVELMRIEDAFTLEINMRKEKLSKLDEQYSKEIEFLKQTQSKGQISGEEFQKRLASVQQEYQTKRAAEQESIAQQEAQKAPCSNSLIIKLFN